MKKAVENFRHGKRENGEEGGAVKIGCPEKREGRDGSGEDWLPRKKGRRGWGAEVGTGKIGQA